MSDKQLPAIPSVGCVGSASKQSPSMAVSHEDPWTSSSSSDDGSSNARIQRKTVRRVFPVNSPRAVKRGANVNVNASGSSSGALHVSSYERERNHASPSPRKRKDSTPNPSPTKISRTPVFERLQRLDDGPTRKRKAKRKPGILWNEHVTTALLPVRLLVSVLASLLGVALSPIQAALSQFVLLALVVTSVYYVFLRTPLQHIASILPSSAFATLAVPFTILPNIKSTYCDVIGLGCTPEPLPIARLARTVSNQAVQAHDIFQSVVALGDPSSMGLHHTEVWELAVAIKASSELENKDYLGSTLKELGDLTRDVKDQMTSLNAMGINSFSWILHEFSRVEKTIELLQTKSSRYTIADVSRQLDNLFEHLSSDLSSLLKNIESTIPLAKRASELGGSVMLELGTEHARLNREKEDVPLWRRLKEINSFKSKQLSRDLQLTGDSVSSLKETRRNLEEARGFLMGYRDQVGYFKASVLGFHIADHGLDPEDEVATLREIIQKFQLSVDSAKGKGIPASEKSTDEP